jgi:hypothetical protein
VLLKVPELYKECQRGLYFSKKTVVLWFLRAIVQALAIFLVSVFCYYQVKFQVNRR